MNQKERVTLINLKWIIKRSLKKKEKKKQQQEIEFKGVRTPILLYYEKQTLAF
jgi:hypothetical protein